MSEGELAMATGTRRLGARTIDIDTPHGAIVAIKRANPLTIVGIPHAGPVVLGGGKEQVALSIVFDHRQRALMSLDDQRPNLIFQGHWLRGWDLVTRRRQGSL